MLTRRSLLAAAATSSTLSYSAATPAEAATPKDVLVMGKQIDDMIALDPAQAYEFTDNELEAIFIANWSPRIRGPAPRGG
jgi:peptide/nickel transport system substrate-binding protein